MQIKSKYFCVLAAELISALITVFKKGVFNQNIATKTSIALEDIIEVTINSNSLSLLVIF